MIPVEAIQRIKEDLEERRKLCSEHGSYNRAAAFEVAIEKLEEVIEQYAPRDTGKARSSSSDDAAEQVQE